jgi:uncharacterized integral membrane protein
MLHYVTTAIALIALILISIFAVQNLAAVQVSFLAWSANVSKILVILGAYVLGMLTGGGLLHLVKGYFNRA